MASLLSKFRIDYSALKVISGISKPAQTETVNFFDSLIADFMEDENASSNSNVDDGILPLYVYVFAHYDTSDINFHFYKYLQIAS